VTAPEPATVRCWGEGEAEQRRPDVLRVLIADQEVGTVAYVKKGTWVAHCRSRGGRDSTSEYSNAESAVSVVVHSGWARRLGARSRSRVDWSEQAKDMISRRRGWKRRRRSSANRSVWTVSGGLPTLGKRRHR
jgi:hypothetical protein